MKRNAQGSSISPGGEGEARGGGRREEEFLGGPQPSVGPAAEEERPSPRALIAVASCPPPPACVCEGERARWVGPMGVIEGSREAEWRFPLPTE